VHTAQSITGSRDLAQRIPEPRQADELGTLAHQEKQSGQDYLLVDGPLASLLNVIGALFGIIFKAAGK
jgi:hypothetical protein